MKETGIEKYQHSINNLSEKLKSLGMGIIYFDKGSSSTIHTNRDLPVEYCDMILKKI